MPFVGSLYSRPRIVPVCIEALMEKIEGRITQAELEERMGELESKQLPLFVAERRRRVHGEPITRS